MTRSLEQRTTVSATSAGSGAERLDAREWRAVFDALGRALIVTSLTGVVRELNTAAERLTGHRAEDAIGRMRIERLHDPSELVERARAASLRLGARVEPGFETLLAAARAGAHDDAPWTYVRKDGSRVSVSLSVEVVGKSSSGRSAVLVTARPIPPAIGDAVEPPRLGAESARAMQPTSPCGDRRAFCPPRSASFSPDELLGRLSGDTSLLDAILDLFQSECPPSLEAIERAVLAGDPDAVARGAHKLRGALLNLGAGSAAAAAMEIETCGRGGSIPPAGSIQTLAAELDRLAAAIGKFRSGREVA
jgi:PAS domain S-box-containing protein